MNELVETKEQGKNITLTNLELMINRACEKAANGDPKSIRFVMQMLDEYRDLESRRKTKAKLPKGSFFTISIPEDEHC